MSKSHKAFAVTSLSTHCKVGVCLPQAQHFRLTGSFLEQTHAILEGQISSKLLLSGTSALERPWIAPKSTRAGNHFRSERPNAKTGVVGRSLLKYVLKEVEVVV